MNGIVNLFKVDSLPKSKEQVAKLRPEGVKGNNWVTQLIQG
jgi:hypothetical protein